MKCEPTSRAEHAELATNLHQANPIRLESGLVRPRGQHNCPLSMDRFAIVDNALKALRRRTAVVLYHDRLVSAYSSLRLSASRS
jgi:hypothetical protein